MFSIIVSPLRVDESREALLVFIYYTPEKNLLLFSVMSVILFFCLLPR